ncbi:carbohydrate-binding domain-containing protein [Paenibacillus mucilaginosus]|uniref:Dockerin type 1 n=1 Tax=Paenibacillus mucilaginosus (strain KNP414) TaxID=1036673 RepID=F8FRD2_PAEMK|nr:carbohydrate-binding domain-containing protein [Paenibacillus mucilaginosus]AEI39382.1 conserved hypothetical protein [Paenibacillus mucilaginosus KNP414]MCG7214775.1 carbohydrate-binding domain-containing protein [Paenibacillus mucilaginosus]WDM28368.1 carbohydrate-binding domain-containing protein [Paenibacillus mucilaginosus]
MKNKHVKQIVMLALLSAVALPACQSLTPAQTAASTESAASQTGAAAASTAAAAATAPAAVTPVEYSDNDLYSDWKSANPNYIELSAEGASIKGTGAEVKDRTVTITAGGTYVLSGVWEQGQIVVNASKEDKVRIVLNGVQIHSKTSSAIQVMQADKTVITVQEGTANAVSDGTQYAAVDDSGEPNAAIFSKDDLTFNGSGTLTVQGNYNNGITSKDDLKITGGTIKVTAVDDGVQGKDLVAVKEGTLTIEAAGDGIKATNDTDASKGFVSIETGTFSIQAGKDGIQAETAVQVNGGTFTISSGGGSANAPAKAKEEMGGMRSAPAAAASTSAGTTAAAEETESGKAIKAGSLISIAGGTIRIDSADDAVHSNNSVTIAGGELSITSGDDGIHADASTVISGGKTVITKSYEGIEGSAVTISGGETQVTASDDGINVAGGADGSATNRPGQNSFSSTSSGNLLTITGGTVRVDSAGDGLDANGSIQMSGGTVYVSGPSANGNGALDYDGSFDYTGGLLAAAGSSGMAQAPSDQSTAYSTLMTYSQAQPAGTVVELKDKDGKVVASFTSEKSFQAIVLGSPDLRKDGTYAIYTGGAKTVEFTIANPTTWLNESGVTTARTGGPGRMGGGGSRVRPEAGTP